MFKKAVKSKSKLRLAIDGVSGSGKTFSSLVLASSLGHKIALLDTEHGSASLYSDKFDFDVVDLAPPYSPERYIEIINAAEQAGYEVLVIDSLSHEWFGEGGCLDLQSKMGGRFQDWAKITPRHNALINKILSAKLHIIATMRSKADYAVSNEGGAKAKVTKLGTAAVQREGMEYEFTINFSLNTSHLATATKDRTGLFDGRDFMITNEIGQQLLDWLNSGEIPTPQTFDGITSEQKETVGELLALISPSVDEVKANKMLSYAVNPALLNALNHEKASSLINKLEEYLDAKQAQRESHADAELLG